MSWREELRRRTFSPEGRRVVGLVSGSHFLNHMFLVLLPPVFGVLATEFDVSLAELGLAVSAMSLSSTAFQLPFGYLSDTVSRTVTMVAGLLTGAAGVFVVAVAGSFPALLAGQVLVGAGIGAHHPANYPLMSDATAEDRRAWAFSVHGTAGHLGYGAAPALIVAVISIPGRTWRDAFLVVAAVTVAYALLSLVVLTRYVADDVTRGGRAAGSDGADDGPRSAKAPLRERARDQFLSLVRSPAVMALTVLALIVAMAGWGFRSFTVVLLTDGYDFGLTTANTVLSVMFVGSAVATLASGLLTDRYSAPAIIVPSYAFVLVAAVAIGSLLVPPAVAAVTVVLGASAQVMGNPPRSKLLDNLSAGADLGVNFAVITVGVTLGGTIAPTLFGVLIERLGFWAAFYLIGAFALLGAAIVVAIVRTYDTSAGAGRAAASDD